MPLYLILWLQEKIFYSESLAALLHIKLLFLQGY